MPSPSPRRRSNSRWLVCIPRCSDGCLYKGITNDLDKWLKAHAAGKASKYTRSRLPVKLVYTEHRKSKSAALKPKSFLRRYSRSMKTDSLLSITNRSMSSNRDCRRLAI